MFGSLITWLRNLSLVGKVTTGLVTVGTVGMVATASQSSSTPQATNPTTSEPKENVPEVTTKEVTEIQDVDFMKTTENTSSLASGQTQLKTAGVKGIRTLTYKITYSDGKETNKELIKDEVTQAPVDEVTYVGIYVAPKPVTKNTNCNPNYSGCVPNASDVDCVGGSGNGPAYVSGPVYVTGIDVYDLDRDGDGVGCE